MSDYSPAELHAASRVRWLRSMRDDQRVPFDEPAWRGWLHVSGRGSGKSRSLTEAVLEHCRTMPDARAAIVAATWADAIRVNIEGESGILSCLPAPCIRQYNRSTGEIRLHNGARVQAFSAEKPDRLRGPQHSFVACDEIAAWPSLRETFDIMEAGLRLGERPRWAAGTTPRSLRALLDLMDRPDVLVRQASTFANAEHLPESFLETLKDRYAGTRWARQELEGQFIAQVEGALWSEALLAQARAAAPVGRIGDAGYPRISRVLVAVDPAVTNSPTANATGIVVVAAIPERRYLVLGDYSLRATPDAWCRRAISAYRTWSADRIIGETNNGGQLIETVLRNIDPTIPYKSVRASRDKVTRAEPVLALYEQGRVAHCGDFPELEDEMLTYVPGEPSPDRLDALVWGLTELAGRSYIGDAPVVRYAEPRGRLAEMARSVAAAPVTYDTNL